MRFVLDLVRGDSVHFSGKKILPAPSDLFLPGGVGVWIDSGIQTGDQISCQFSAFGVGQGKRLLQEFAGFPGHDVDYIAGGNSNRQTLNCVWSKESNNAKTWSFGGRVGCGPCGDGARGGETDACPGEAD